MTDDLEPPKTGYKSPPKAAQFAKGQSGNPQGRPKGAKNNKTIFESLAAAHIEGKLPGSDEKISVREGVIAKLASKALEGDPRCLNKFIDTMAVYDEKNEAYCREAELAVIDLILKCHEIAQLKAGEYFNAKEAEIIGRFLKAVSVEFQKLAPIIEAQFDKNKNARREILTAAISADLGPTRAEAVHP